MTTMHADVATAHASRYLQQLCKHWSHRFEVNFDPTHGKVQLPGAFCIFDAEPERLLLTLEAEDSATLPRLCEVVADHLGRFAFRENLVIAWKEAAA